jgi:hypothetical protein
MEKASIGSRTNERRVGNLREIRSRFAQQEDLARALEWTAPYLCQLIGPHPTRPITERTARKIERRLGLPDGALDADPASGTGGGRWRTAAASFVAPVMAAVDDEIARHRRTLSREQYRALVDYLHRQAVARGSVDRNEVKGLLGLLSQFA